MITSGRYLCLALVLSCGGSSQSTPPAATESTAPSAAESEQSPATEQEELVETGPWWQRTTIACESGERAQQTLSWGRIVRCEVGERDRRMENDFGRLTRCVRDAVMSTQSEPDGDLGRFISKALEQDIAPDLCSTLRIDEGPQVLYTHNGREVEYQRVLVSEVENAYGAVERSLRYRFSCSDCSMVAETTVTVIIPAP